MAGIDPENAVSFDIGTASCASGFHNRRWTMTTTMPELTAEREAMVERQLKRRGITNPLILDAFRAVPREAFVGAEHVHLAYRDHPLPIAAGQTISQPYIVALMIEA